MPANPTLLRSPQTHHKGQEGAQVTQRAAELLSPAHIALLRYNLCQHCAQPILVSWHVVCCCGCAIAAAAACGSSAGVAHCEYYYLGIEVGETEASRWNVIMCSSNHVIVNEARIWLECVKWHN